MEGLVVAGLTTWQYEGTTAKKKHEHRISYLTGGGLLMEGQEARPTGILKVGPNLSFPTVSLHRKSRPAGESGHAAVRQDFPGDARALPGAEPVQPGPRNPRRAPAIGLRRR